MKLIGICSSFKRLKSAVDAADAGMSLGLGLQSVERIIAAQRAKIEVTFSDDLRSSGLD